MTANKLATILAVALVSIALYELWPLLASFVSITGGQ